MSAPVHGIAAIVPCNDLDVSERFYARLGFKCETDSGKPFPHGDYRILRGDRGGCLHLNIAVPGWLVPGRNPFGLYFCVEDVDGLAAIFGAEIIESGKRPEHKPWGMYEFRLSDPNETLVRVGWPSRLLHGR